MNILFSTDDKYAPILGVAICSLIEHNLSAEQLRFFIVDNCISEENRAKLEKVVEPYSHIEIQFISFDNYQKQLALDLPWPISMSAYARLFASEMIPGDVDRLLYLDCDMVVNQDLSDLWQYDLGEYYLGAIQDLVFPTIKTAIGLSSEDAYFNSGLLLVDLKKWREMDISGSCLDFIKQKKGRVIHHDQGVLNRIFANKWKRLPIRFNVMTIHYTMSLDKVKKYFNDYSTFYSEQEIALAKQYPSILHFTPSFTTHPWETGCKHPRRSLFFTMLEKTPWKGLPLSKPTTPWYVRIIDWRYRTLPF